MRITEGTNKKLVLTALMIAVVFLLTFIIHIPSPIPGGYFNIGDAAIMITAILLGGRAGFIAGAIGSALSDYALGYMMFVPVTFVVKGIEGLVVGLIANKNGKASEARKIIAIVVGALIMVVGYLVFELTVVRLLLDKTLAVSTIIAELPGNLIQGGASAIIAYSFLAVLEKTNIIKKLKL